MTEDQKSDIPVGSLVKFHRRLSYPACDKIVRIAQNLNRSSRCKGSNCYTKISFKGTEKSEKDSK